MILINSERLQSVLIICRRTLQRLQRYGVPGQCRSPVHIHVHTSYIWRQLVYESNETADLCTVVEPWKSHFIDRVWYEHQGVGLEDPVTGMSA